MKEEDAFYRLVQDVRKHRANMDIKVAPAAREETDIRKKVAQLCEEEFYREDYEIRTKGLISDDTGYDEVICFCRELMERIFR